VDGATVSIKFPKGAPKPTYIFKGDWRSWMIRAILTPGGLVKSYRTHMREERRTELASESSKESEDG